jgi:hypothetical protein
MVDEGTGTPVKASPPAAATTAEPTVKTLRKVRLLLDGLPYVDTFTASNGVVLTRAGVELDADEAAFVRDEAVRYGQIVREEEVE